MSRSDAICHRGLRACRVLNKKKNKKKQSQWSPFRSLLKMSNIVSHLGLLWESWWLSMFAVLLERFYLSLLLLLYFIILVAASLPSLSAQCTASPLSSLLSLHFHSSHLRKKKKTSSGALSQLSNASPQIHVKFCISSARCDFVTEKRKKKKEKKNRKIDSSFFSSFLSFFRSFFFLIEWRKVEIKGFGTIFYSGVGSFLPRLGKKGADVRVA